MIANADDLKACAGHPVAIDIETDCLEWWKGRIIGVGFYDGKTGAKGYVPTLDDDDALRGALSACAAIAEDADSVIIAHNLVFEALWLNLNLRKAPCKFYDTMVMAHLQDSRQRKGLEACAERFLGIPETKRVFREAGRNQPIHKWPLELVSRYCVNDCEVEFQLFMKLWGELRSLGLLSLLKKDMRYLALIVEVQRRGMLVDQNFMDRAERVISQNVVLMERDLHEAVGKEFNWRSTKQLSHALYEDMGIAKPVNPFLDEFGVDRSKGKSPLFNRYNSSCTSSFLLMEKAHHPLGPLVLDLRESDKFCKNYLRDWRELLDANSVIHASFNLTGTRTGRLSSSRPNLQNLPGDVRTRETQSVYSGGTVRSDEYNLRQAFIARPGFIFLSVDYKQQEMRLFALLSRDKKMIEAVRNRLDIHMFIAKLVWGDCGKELNKIHREWSKTIGFGLLYGMTTGTLQHRLNMSIEESRQVTSTYLEAFPRIMPYMREVIEECRKTGYLRYWSGRIWREENPAKHYKGVNALVQGGGADLLSIGALRAQDWLDAQGAGHIVSYIHDELLLEVKEDAIHDAITAIPQVMEVEDLFSAPFLTEWKAGYSYGTLVEGGLPPARASAAGVTTLPAPV